MLHGGFDILETATHPKKYCDCDSWQHGEVVGPDTTVPVQQVLCQKTAQYSNIAMDMR